MKLKEFTQSTLFTRIIISIGALLVALIIFQAGIFIGYHSAAFSINWDKARTFNIVDPRSIFAPFNRDSDDMNPHGAVGEIIGLHLPDIMVKGVSGNESMVLITSTTSIRNMRGEASTSDLRVGQQVVTIGTPDDQGQVRAVFIRIIPTGAQASTTPVRTLPSNTK